MTPPVRKNYKFLTIAKKLELLQESDKKLLSKGKLALKYGIPCSTLSTILKNRNRLEEAVLSDKDCETRLKLRPAQYEELESKVCILIFQQCSFRKFTSFGANADRKGKIRGKAVKY